MDNYRLVNASREFFADSYTTSIDWQMIPLLAQLIGTAWLLRAKYLVLSEDPHMAGAMYGGCILLCFTAKHGLWYAV